jgi:hypothetical protein
MRGLGGSAKCRFGLLDYGIIGWGRNAKCRFGLLDYWINAIET